jgi:hypothetical protein
LGGGGGVKHGWVVKRKEVGKKKGMPVAALVWRVSAAAPERK